MFILHNWYLNSQIDPIRMRGEFKSIEAAIESAKATWFRDQNVHCIEFPEHSITIYRPVVNTESGDVPSDDSNLIDEPVKSSRIRNNLRVYHCNGNEALYQIASIGSFLASVDTKLLMTNDAIHTIDIIDRLKLLIKQGR